MALQITQTAVGVGLGAIVGLLWFARDIFKARAPEREASHGNVHGAAEATSNLDQLIEAGLTANTRGGLFIGIWRECRAIKRLFRRPRMVEHVVDLWYRAETSSLLVAPPRSGKGACCIVPTLMGNDADSKLTIDPKGQNAAVCIPSLRARGHVVEVFNPTGTLPDLLPPPAQCNPAASWSLDDPNVETVAAECMAICVPVRPEEKNPFFSGAAQELASGMALFAREWLGAWATLPVVAEMLHEPPHRLNDLFGLMRQSRFASVRATGNKYHSYFVKDKLCNAPTTGTLDVIGTAQRETAFLMKGGIAHMFGAAGCDFARMKRDLCAWFVCVPEGASEAMAKATHLLLATAKNALLRPGGRQVQIVADELCTALPDTARDLMQNLYAFAPGYRVTVLGVAHSWAQLVAWAGSPEKANALRAAAGATIFYGANDPMTSAYIREAAGSYTVWTPSTDAGKEYGAGGGAGPMGVPLLTDDALRVVHREGWQVVFLLGSRRVVVIPRTPYWNVAEFQARAAPDPFHL